MTRAAGPNGSGAGGSGAGDPDDGALLRAHVAGDADAFGLLFSRHRDRLWAVALRTTGDPEEAADALQDAMVAAFRRAASFRGESAVTTWLHRIVVNASLDRLRRRTVRLAEPLPSDDQPQQGRSTAALAPVVDSGVPASATVADPADLAVDHERRVAVLEALATLPVEQRAALVLVDMEGYSVDEAAAILQCAPGTVKSRCSRGRARLLPLLRDDYGRSGGNREGDRRVPAEGPGTPAEDPGSGRMPDMGGSGGGATR
jgi:RNA polymerase sigma-70 factor (ECF subfamily)